VRFVAGRAQSVTGIDAALRRIGADKEAALGELVIFEDEAHPVEVRLEGETVWLTQKRMAKLFGKDLRTVNEHIGNVYEEGELDREGTIRNFRIVRAAHCPVEK